MTDLPPLPEDPMRGMTLLAFVVGICLLLGGCSAPCPKPVDPCGHIGPGLTYRGIGHDGRPACQACGAGKCG